jgi:probable HAF family extracellular repeat protein
VVCLLALASISVMPLVRSHAQPPPLTYTVTDLGTLGGATSRAYGINNCGSVVGESTIPGVSAPFHPFFWNGSTMIDLGTFGGNSGAAVRLSNTNFAVGSARTFLDELHAFIWHDDNGNNVADAGELKTVPALPGGLNAAANDVNDAAQAVGTSEVGVLLDAAFRWDATTGSQQLPTGGGISKAVVANGINNAGNITGIGNSNSGETHAFLYAGGVMIDLGRLPPNPGDPNLPAFSFGLEISEDNYVVGYSEFPSNNASKPQHAFIFHDTNGNNLRDTLPVDEMQDLGTLGGTNSVAYDINAGHDVVGMSNSVLGDRHAFIWQSGVMTDLNLLIPGDPGWVLQEARSINDAGQIAGIGTIGGQTHAFLLNPTGFSPSPCSPPATTVSSVSGSGVYNSTLTLTATLTSVAGPLSGKTISFTVDGSSVCGGGGQPACPTTNSSGVATVNITGQNAGAHPMVATFAGDAAFATSNAAGTLTVSQVSSTTTVTVSDAIYDGLSHGGSAVVTGAGGLNQSLTVSYTAISGTTYGPSPTAPINAGNYSASATFAGDTNHTGSTDSKNFQITQAASTTTVTVSNATYDGSPHGGTANVTGPGGLNQSLTVTYLGIGGTNYGPLTTAPTVVGSYSASAGYLGDTNRAASSDSKNFQITQATSTTTVTVSDAIYDGSSHGGSAVVTGAGGLNQSLMVTYTGTSGTTYNSTTAPINAGNYTASATFAGDTNHTGSSDSKPFQITKANQAITVNTHAPASATFNTSFGVAATGGGSGNAVTFTSSGGCSNIGATFTMTSGTTQCSVKFDQAGDGNYNAATQVVESVIAQKASQTITVNQHAPTSATFNTSFGVAATGGGSGNAVTFSSAGGCSNVGATFTMTSGTTACSVKFDQAGNSDYNAVSTVTETVTAQKASQTITFGTLANKAFGDPPFTVSATGGASLNAVTFSATGNCTSSGTNGSTITITGAGSCSVTASQAGDSNYSAAADVTRSFTISQISQTITFGSLSNKTFGDAPFTVSATGGASGNPVNFSATGNCTAGGTDGSTITITGAGSCTVTASQNGNVDYNAATPVSQGFSIAKALTTLGISSSANPSASGQNVTFTATVSSSAGTPTGTVQFKVDGVNAGSAAALNGSGVATFSTSSLATGTHSINADYNGDSNFNISSGSLAVGQTVGSIFQFSQTGYSVSEGQDFATITVTRTGDLTAPATVKYATSDATDVNFNCNPNTAGQIVGAASRKCDYHIAVGRLRFAAGESQKQIFISLVDDVYVEGAETLSISLSSPTGMNVGSPNIATVTIADNDTPGQPNPIDGTGFYVRMLYVDLLSREPDPGGFAGWVHRIDFCGQPGEPPPPCDRVTVGGVGFLQSSEFFDREFFVIRLYRSGLGRLLVYDDVPDIAFVSGFLTEAELELNKQELVAEIMSRPEFGGIYNGLGNSQYVDTLIQKAAVTLPAGVRDDWVNALNGATKTRAQVFREISERPEVSAKYLNEARVVSCYYGFFTRNPDGAYLDLLDRLDRGVITMSDIANVFINASEYRRRFGP